MDVNLTVCCFVAGDGHQLEHGQDVLGTPVFLGILDDCGCAVSGNLEFINFDCAGEAFTAWSAHVTTEAAGLLDRLMVETSPSGGWHIIYSLPLREAGEWQPQARPAPREKSECSITSPNW